MSTGKNAVAIAAPILPGKLDDWKEFGRNLHEGPKHNDYKAFIKKAGLSRVRCWLQQGPESAVGIILYEAIKQRQDKGYSSRLSEEEYDHFMKKWLGIPD